MGLLSRSEIRSLYDRTAPIYDGALFAYKFLGVQRQRRAMIQMANIRPGDTVIDLGCGTGANLPFLAEAAGPRGRIIGIDLSIRMLERARALADRSGWSNVDLIQGDIAEASDRFEFDAAIAAFALEMVPNYSEIIATIARRLPPGGRLASIGLKHPDRWPDWLVDFAIAINKPFGVSRDYQDVAPWQAMGSHLHDITFQELWWGAGYRCVGTGRSLGTAVATP